MRYKSRSVLPMTIALFALVAALLAINAYAEGLGGSWEGKVTQDNPSSTYPMEMNLYGEKGNINYPSLSCGGNLEFVRTDGKSYWYREHLTYGKDKCIDGGMIQMHRHALGDDTYWDWRWDGGGATVRGVIRGSGVREK